MKLTAGQSYYVTVKAKFGSITYSYSDEKEFTVDASQDIAPVPIVSLADK